MPEPTDILRILSDDEWHSEDYIRQRINPLWRGFTKTFLKVLVESEDIISFSTWNGNITYHITDLGKAILEDDYS